MSAVAADRLDATTERLYALLPAHVRMVDAKNGWPLKAFVRILSLGSAEIDVEIDRLYAAQFIETAPEESLADFAALLGAEALRPLPEGAAQNMRAYIANTIRYRRGKGTARVLEALATDIGGFAAIAVEYYQRLARTQHLLDPRPERPGLARLVAGDTGALAGTAHDFLPRLADFRAMTKGGKHHIANVGVHVLRPKVPYFAGPAGNTGITAKQLDGVPVAGRWDKAGSWITGYFCLSAHNGGILRLFNPDRRSQDDRPRTDMTDLPDRLRRLPLHRETEELRRAKAEGRPEQLAEPPWFDDLGRPFAIFERREGASTFSRIPPEQIRICRIDKLPTPQGERPEAKLVHRWGYDKTKPPPGLRTANMPIRCGFDPATGRLIMAKLVGSEPEIAEVRVSYATGIGFPIGAGAQDRGAPDVALDVSDRDADVPFVCIVDETITASSGSATQDYLTVATLRDALVAWEAAAPPAGTVPPLRGYIVLIRCDRFAGLQLNVKVHSGSTLEIVSGQWVPPAKGPGIPSIAERRGFIVRKERRFTIDAKTKVEANPIAGRPTPGVLKFDGIEFTRGIEIGDAALSELRLRHCTLRRPGEPALSSTAAPFDFNFHAERCILGRIAFLDGARSAGCKVVLRDCIVSRDGANAPAIELPRFDADFANLSIFGATTLRVVEATNAIFLGPLTAERTQAGCLRYSYVPPGPNLPRRFRCQPELSLAQAMERKGSSLTDDERDIATFAAQPRFLDTALDEPTVGMLHPGCSDAIRRGGEGDVEIGAFALAAEGLRLENVARFYDDYVPFGLAAATIDDTRSAAVVAARIKP